MVYVHLAEGFEEIEALTIIDVLRRAGIDVSSVAVRPETEASTCGDGCRAVKGAHDIKVKADLLFEEADYTNCDMIVLPGGMPGAANLAAHKGLTAHIREFAAAGKPLAAICAAPMVFGDMGLLEGRKATIYPGMEEHLRGASVKNYKAVVDGNFITSRGPATAMAFALAIVAYIKDEKLADKLAKDMLYEL